MNRVEHISFDNLALEQLGIRSLVTPEIWERNFMGPDGQFTMYVDAVRNEYAVSSTSPRFELNKRSAREVFPALKA